MSFTNVETQTINYTPFPLHTAFASINAVPVGAAWQATAGPIPYADATIGYDGFTHTIGDSVTYDPTTHKWTVHRPGVYNVTVINNIDVGNSVGTILSDGRLKLVNSSGAQIGQDSGRQQTTAGMAATGMLAYDMEFSVMDLLQPDDYTVVATAENGGPGLLLGKGSCTFMRLV